jgi:hypothetical protein
MPAAITHLFLGHDVQARVPGEGPAPGSCQQLFLLGNQGPDPFFYALRTTSLVKLKQFGHNMHMERVTATIDSMRRYLASLPDEQRLPTDAYIRGFLCHFALDSIAHPLVIAQELDICNAGVDGLGPEDRSVVHGQIEAELDAMMVNYQASVGLQAPSASPAFGLAARRADLALIDQMYAQVAAEVFDLRLPVGAFGRCVRDMRATLNLLYGRGSRRRGVIVGLERLFRRHSLVQAMSRHDEVGKTCDFDNHEGNVWVNPFNGEISMDSFLELYYKARDRAITILDDHEALAPTEQLTRGLNFEGRKI